MSDSSTQVLRIIIIPKAEKSVRAVASFITRRSHEVLVVSSLKEAIDSIPDFRPDFVLLSINLPNVNIDKAYQLLTDSFPVPTIVFGEIDDAMTAANIEQIKAPFVLHAPVSGPKILMRIQRFKLENGAIGEKDRPVGRVTTQAPPAQGKKKSNITFVKSDKKEVETKPGIMIQKGAPELKRGEVDWESMDKEPDLDHGYDPAGPAGNAHGSTTMKNAKPQDGGSTTTTGAKSKAPRAVHHEPERAPDGQSKSHEKLNDAAKPKRKSEFDSFRNPVIYPSISGPGVNSILAESTFLVLNDHTESTDEERVRVTATQQVAAISINSPRFNGYLVAALGENKEIGSRFMEIVKRKLADYLTMKGEPVESLEPNFDVQIQKVEFTAWAQEYAEFLALASIESDELAMAFISGEDAMPIIGPSSHVDMSSVEIEELRPGKNIDFDLYLYLPVNKKFILYVASSGYLSSDQMFKLLERGISKLHVRKADRKKFQIYCGREFIRDKIANPKKKSRKKDVA